MLGDEGAIAIAPAIEKLLDLNKFDVADNGIGIEGAKALAAAFIDHKALKRIELVRSASVLPMQASYRAWMEHGQKRSKEGLVCSLDPVWTAG